MTFEEFLFRIGSLFFVIAVVLFWVSQKTDKVSTDVCTYFFMVAFSFAIAGIAFTIGDLVKWVFKG